MPEQSRLILSRLKLSHCNLEQQLFDVMPRFKDALTKPAHCAEIDWR
jgi:hypothetical protein